MEAYSEKMGEFFTTTPVPPDMLVDAGHAADRKCNVPQQLGVGVKGGAEMIIAGVRTHLGLNPGHAVASDDKKNGFNTMWRRAIFRGLRRWFPELIPTVRLWYARRGCLFTFGSLATDRDDRVYYSEEGCAQGDPLGPFLWAIDWLPPTRRSSGSRRRTQTVRTECGHACGGQDLQTHFFCK